MKHYLFLATLLLSAACGSDEETPDAEVTLDGGPDAAPDASADAGYEIPRCDPHGDVERGGDGAAVLWGEGASGARAGRITRAEDLLPGPKRRGEVGDFLIANDRVAFVIEDGRPSDGYQPFGGEIADASVVGADGRPEEGLWGDMLWGMGPRVIEPDTVGVLADGSDGGPAIVRVVGPFVDLPFFKEVAATFLPLYLNFDGAVDFTLAPGADALEVRVHLWNNRVKREYVDLAIFLFMMGDGIEQYVPGVGFAGGSLPPTFPSLAFAGAGDVAYAFLPAEGFELVIEVSEATVLRAAPFFIDECGETDFEVGHVAVGRSVDDLEQARRALEGDTSAQAVRGSVVDPDGQPARGARVHLTSADGTTHVTMAVADDDGTFTLHAPSGSYALWAFGDGPGAAPVDVDVAGADVDLPEPVVLGARGILEVNVTDLDGQPIPGKVVLHGQASTPPAEMFGEPTPPGDFAGLAFAAHGSARFALEPGSYEVTIGRGFEHESVVREVDVPAGETVVLTEALDRVVDTTGWMSADFHVHSFWSPDSSDSLAFKVRSAAAEGLEIPVSTEHEWIGDLQPAVVSEGLEAFVRGMSGEEITTFAYGHFNAYPATARPELPNNGAFQWVDRTLGEVVADVRQDPADPVVQINHPRSQSFGGYFTSVGFDPDTGTVEDSGNWTTDFDAVEVFNGSSFEENLDGTVPDWFRLIEMGVRPTATGNSDSHHSETSEVGYPRTYVLLGEDDPTLVSPAAVADAIRTGHAVVSGGAFVSVTADGAQAVGETVSVTAGVPTSLHVTVQAPGWVELSRLRVFVSGEEVDTIELSGVAPVRFDEDVSVTVDDDAWVVFAAAGDTPLDPLVTRKQPFGVTNPVYLDVP